MSFIQRIITCIGTICNAQWTAIYEPPLPLADYDMAYGSYNDSIFLIGGFTEANDVTEYKISTNTMIYYGETNADRIWVWSGTYCHQLNDTLYIYSHTYSALKFLAYDLKTTNFWKYPSFLPLADNPANHYCIAGNNRYLTKSGGFGENGEDQVRVFIFSNSTWIHGTPMLISRMNHGCCFVDDYLYAIGGYVRDTIEKIHSDDLVISSRSWSLFQTDQFVAPIEEPSIVPYFHYIYVLGNRYTAYSTSIYVVNTIDDSIELLPEQLPYDVHAAAAVVVNDILYMFGGRNSTKTKTYNSWIKHQLSPSNATRRPSGAQSFRTTVGIRTTADIPSVNENDQTVDIRINITVLWIVAISLSVCIFGAICCFFYCLYDRARMRRYVKMNNLNESNKQNIRENAKSEDFVCDDEIVANVKQNDNECGERGNEEEDAVNYDDEGSDDEDNEDLYEANENKTGGNDTCGAIAVAKIYMQAVNTKGDTLNTDYGAADA